MRQSSECIQREVGPLERVPQRLEPGLFLQGANHQATWAEQRRNNYGGVVVAVEMGPCGKGRILVKEKKKIYICLYIFNNNKQKTR